MAARTTLPKGWRLPTPQTLAQYAHGIEQGLVPAGNPVLHRAAEAVPLDEIRGQQARQTLDRMYSVIGAMREAGRPILGLAAPQIGESAQVIFVPRHTEYRDDTYGDLMPVFNPEMSINERAARVEIPHGCFSSNEVFVRLPSASELTLTGFDMYGDPVVFERTGQAAVVDEHEIRHLLGVRAADIAVRDRLQIDWRPPEMLQEYREFFTARQAGSSELNWPEVYPHSQWVAARIGDFMLENYYDK